MVPSTTYGEVTRVHYWTKWLGIHAVFQIKISILSSRSLQQMRHATCCGRCPSYQVVVVARVMLMPTTTCGKVTCVHLQCSDRALMPSSKPTNWFFLHEVPTKCARALPQGIVGTRLPSCESGKVGAGAHYKMWQSWHVSILRHDDQAMAGSSIMGDHVLPYIPSGIGISTN